MYPQLALSFSKEGTFLLDLCQEIRKDPDLTVLVGDIALQSGKTEDCILVVEIQHLGNECPRRSALGEGLAASL